MPEKSTACHNAIQTLVAQDQGKLVDLSPFNEKTRLAKNQVGVLEILGKIEFL